jgi:hypothetical protein
VFMYYLKGEVVNRMDVTSGKVTRSVATHRRHPSSPFSRSSGGIFCPE